MRSGIVPVVVEVRERVSERGVFWTERLLVGVEGQVLLDTTQLTGGTYDPATEEMVYRVLTPWGTLGLPATDTFLWAQAQWVGVPLAESNAPPYREGEANDAVDVTLRTLSPTVGSSALRRDYEQMSALLSCGVVRTAHGGFL